MSSGTSYNGWPANSDPGAIGINSGFCVDGMSFPGGVKGGSVATVYTHLIRDLVVIDPPNSTAYNIEGFWGYSFKSNVNNPSQLSCHASGTAIDYRAVAHPNVQGSSYIGWSSNQISQVKTLLADKYRGLVAWLSYDSMHFEICGNSGQISDLANSLGEEEEDMALSSEDINRIADEVMDRLVNQKVADMMKIDEKGVESTEKASIVRTLQSAQTQARRAVHDTRTSGVKVKK
jgi:hypothetical protein